LSNLNKLIAAFLLIFTCSSSGLTDDRKDQRKLRVGLSLPLTGVASEYGTASMNGIKLAQKHHPEFFTNITFIPDDNQYSARNSVTSVQRLHGIEKVDILYLFGETPAVSAAPIVESMKLPTISMSQDETPARGKNYFVRNINHAELYSIKLLEHLRERGWKNLAIVETIDSYTTQLIDGLKKNLREDETLTIIDRFDSETQDFRSSILKLRRANIDALGIYLFPGQIEQFSRQARQAGYSIPVFGNELFESATIIEGSEGFLEGAVYPGLMVDEEFRKEYKKAYGNDIVLSYAALGYDTAVFIGRLFNQKNPDELDPRTIMETIEAASTIEGVLGTYTYQNDDEAGKFFQSENIIFKIDGNSIVSWEPAE